MNCTMMQRKALFLLLLVTVVSLPLLSRAMTQHEWNQGCYHVWFPQTNEFYFVRQSELWAGNG